MFAHRVEAVVNQEGNLYLGALPFRPGDKVEIIILKQGDSTLQQKQRMVGEYDGKIRMSDDFTSPLPDSFWIGESD
jgi:hypothetical protein